MDPVRLAFVWAGLLLAAPPAASTDSPSALFPWEISHAEVVALFEGDDPTKWPPERVFEEYYEGGRYNEWERPFHRSVHLRRIIDRHPDVYGEVCAEILTVGSNPSLFGSAADFVAHHPDKDRARDAILKFLERGDIAPKERDINGAASALGRVGHPEDAEILLPCLTKRRSLSSRTDLWRILVRYAGPDFGVLMDQEIANLENMKARGDSPYDPEELARHAGQLRHLKRELERRHSGERSSGESAPHPPAAPDAEPLLIGAGPPLDVLPSRPAVSAAQSPPRRALGLTIAVCILAAGVVLRWITRWPDRR